MAGIMWQSRLGESAMKLSNRTSDCCAQERKQAVNMPPFEDSQEAAVNWYLERL